MSTTHDLIVAGLSRGQIAAQLAAGRWQRAGFTVVRHNGPLSTRQQWEVARLHAGPQALLTAFTAAKVCGLRGWERDAAHVLAPAGTRLRAGCPVPVRLHLHLHGPTTVVEKRGGVHALPGALLIAASTFTAPRPACGLLAAAVQQRLARPAALRAALDRSPRVRHRATMRAAVADIMQGAEALSEIDFARLCRHAGLPEPERQDVRPEPSGRRRYLDAVWRRADGRLVVVEVDGALHLIVTTWWNDQLRQNELVLADALLLPRPAPKRRRHFSIRDHERESARAKSRPARDRQGACARVCVRPAVLGRARADAIWAG